MVDENPNGQELESTHPLDVGTRTTKVTRATDIKVRSGHLPDVALNVALGNYPSELITVQACQEVHGSGGVALVERVLIYFLAHYNASSKTIEASQSKAAKALRRDRATINKCLAVLKNVGLLVDVGTGRGGTRKYQTPLIDAYLESAPVVQSVVEPVVQGVVQGVGISTHIQNSTTTQQHSYDEAKLFEHYRESYDIALAFAGDKKPEYNTSVARAYVRVMQHATAWQDQPELYGVALKARLGTRTESGGILQAMRELVYEPPKPKLELCGVDECNGNLHVDPETKVPFPCPKRNR